MNTHIRKATIEDSALILSFIKELAEYEKLADNVIGTIEHIHKTLFCDNPNTEAWILEENNQPIGYVLFFHNFSTFLCRHGIYLEDLFVKENHRGKGYGKMLLQHVCKLAMERDCGRVEWWCLDWNKPSIDFYLSLGAEPMTDWTTYRLNRKEIEVIAKA